MSMLGDSGLSGLPKQLGELLEVGHAGPAENTEAEVKALDPRLVATVALYNPANRFALNNTPSTQNLPLANIVGPLGVPATNFASELMSRVVRTAYSATLLQSLGKNSQDGNLTFALRPL